MKIHTLIFVLILIPFLGCAQRVWETQVGVGINSVQGSMRYHEESFKAAPCIIIGKSWYKQTEKKLSLRKEMSIEFIQTNYFYESGGHGGHSYTNGDFYGSYAFAALLPQIKMGEAFFVLGPRIGGLIGGYDNRYWSWWCGIYPDYYSGEGTKKEFTRDIFNNLQYGFKSGFASMPLVKDRLSLSFFFNLTFTKSHHYEEENYTNRNFQFYAILNFKGKKRPPFPKAS